MGWSLVIKHRVNLRDVAIFMAYAYAALIPFETALDFFFGVETILKPYRIVGLFFGIVYLARLVSRPKSIKVDVFDIGLAAIFGWGLFMAAFWSLTLGRSLTNSAGIGSLIAFAFAAFFMLKRLSLSERELSRLLMVYLISSTISIALRVALDPEALALRLSGFYTNPNNAGFDAVVLILFCVSWALYKELNAKRIGLLLLAIGFGLFTIITSGSRAAIISLVVGMISLMIAVWQQGKISGRLLLFASVALFAGGVGTTIGLQYMSSGVGYRFSSESIETGGGRKDLWRGAIRAAIDHYFLGVGLGQYPSLNRQYIAQLDTLYDARIADRDLVTHSDLLDLLTSYGAPGLLIFIALSVRLIMALWHSTSDPRRGFLGALCFAIYIVLLVNQASRNLFTGPQFFFLLAVVITSVKAYNSVSGRSANATGIAAGSGGQNIGHGRAEAHLRSA